MEQAEQAQRLERTERAAKVYGNTLYRLCLVQLGQTADAEDAVQEVLLRHLTKGPDFQEPEHEKAWLLRVALNVCRNQHRFRRRHTCLPLDEAALPAEDKEAREVLLALGQLPPDLRAPLILHYVEGYQGEEIARLLGISHPAVRKRLQRGRQQLRNLLEAERSG